MKNFSWQVPEYVHSEKSSDWYWTVGIIAASLVVVSIIFGNVLFALVIALGVFILTLFSVRKPKIVSIEITEKGIRMDKTLYPFATLESFGVDEHHHHGPKLHLRSKKRIVPIITIAVHPEDMENIKEILETQLKEEMFDQSIIHNLFERIGF